MYGLNGTTTKVRYMADGDDGCAPICLCRKPGSSSSRRNTIMSNLFAHKSLAVGRCHHVGMQGGGAGPGDRLADFWRHARLRALPPRAGAPSSQPLYRNINWPPSVAQPPVSSSYPPHPRGSNSVLQIRKGPFSSDHIYRHCEIRPATSRYIG